MSDFDVAPAVSGPVLPYVRVLASRKGAEYVIQYHVGAVVSGPVLPYVRELESRKGGKCVIFSDFSRLCRVAVCEARRRRALIARVRAANV